MWAYPHSIHWGSGPCTNSFGLSPDYNACTRFANQTYCKAGMSSTHANGFNVVFGDGSVRFASTNTNMNVFRGLATRAGGEVVTTNF
jgi:prepilin-type processing-associated H-X9-DG protein